MGLFDRFRSEKERKPVIPDPLVVLSKLEFEYLVSANRFRNFFYTLEVNLPLRNVDRIAACKASVEEMVRLMDQIYPASEGFRKNGDGKLNANSRKLEINYQNPHGFSCSSNSLHFTADFDGDTIIRAYTLVFLYGEQKDLLAAHDSFLGLRAMELSREAKLSLKQIQEIRNGRGPRIENFLLT